MLISGFVFIGCVFCSLICVSSLDFYRVCISCFTDLLSWYVHRKYLLVLEAGEGQTWVGDNDLWDLLEV